MGERFIWDARQERVVPADDYQRPIPARSSIPAPMIASDCMEPVQSMLDGRMYDSKSRLRATYRAAGVVEVGNDPARNRPAAKPAPDRQGIRQSLQKAVAQVS